MELSHLNRDRAAAKVGHPDACNNQHFLGLDGYGFGGGYFYGR